MKTSNKTRIFADSKMPYVELRYSKTNLDYKEHIHDTLSIGAISKGSRIYRNQNKDYNISKNDLAIINPNTPHSCNSIDKNQTDYYMLYINKEWLFKIQKEINPSQTQFWNFQETLIHNKKDYETFIHLCEILLSKTFYLEKEAILTEFITNLYLQYLHLEEKTYINQNSKINSIIEFLKDNIQENISLDELSQQFNLSTFYIIKLFKKELGIAVYTYFINLKVEYAKTLLKKGYSIVNTALECGFYDQSHFHRNFLKISALTPKEYQDNFVQ
ncbi:MAG: AraC family transcriptional regulator [Halarcobacter sp.]